MATQTLEFNAGIGLTISCKLFALESDTIVATVTATEKTNDQNRYSVAFTDIPAGAYRLNGFVSGVAGFANEIYDLLLVTDVYLSRSEAAAAGGGASAINVLPAVGIVADRSLGATITPVVGETISQSITLYATDGTTAINLTGKTLVIVFETLSGTDVAVVANANITVSGGSSNVVTFAYPSAVTSVERTLRFAIRDAAAPLTEYLKGVCNVTRSPQVDA